MRGFGQDTGFPPIDEVGPVVDETADVLRQGRQFVDDASMSVRSALPLHQQPQTTLILTTALAGAVGGAIGRPVAGALVGAALGWFAYKTWGPQVTGINPPFLPQA